MEFSASEIRRGIGAGRDRCISVVPQIRINEAVVERTEVLIAAVLRGEPAQWHPRAIALFSELITIGALCRAHYKEAELTAAEVGRYLGVIRSLFNSFTHK